MPPSAPGSQPRSTSPFDFRTAGATHVGRQRAINEDAYFLDEHHGFFVLCDGMGGHASGQIASELAKNTIVEALCRARPPAADPEALLISAMLAANDTVFARAQEDPDCHGMGTTAVGARIEHDRMYIAHCGDSRVYQLRNGLLSQLTRDHSLANLYSDRPEMAGKLGPATSNVIVRAIGLKEHVEIDHRSIALEHGDMYLLCCDGLTDLVDDWMILELMNADEPLPIVASRLIEAANENGGTDNITVIVISVCNETREFPRPHEDGTRPGF